MWRFIARVNRFRRENPLQHDRTLFQETDNSNPIFCSKTSPERSNVIIIVVNLDRAHAQSGWVTLDFLRSSWSLEGLSPPRMCWAEEDICGKRRDYIELVQVVFPGVFYECGG